MFSRYENSCSHVKPLVRLAPHQASMKRGPDTCRVRSCEDQSGERAPKLHEERIEPEARVDVELLRRAPRLAHEGCRVLRATSEVERHIGPEIVKAIGMSRGALCSVRNHDEIAIPRCDLLELS